jgi:hypothetical protein
MLIMDFSKTFNNVSHSLLLHNLHNHGIKGKVNSWIKSFLINMTQAVIIEGEI